MADQNFMSKTKVARLGAGFIADIHVASDHRFVPDAAVVIVWLMMALCAALQIVRSAPARALLVEKGQPRAVLIVAADASDQAREAALQFNCGVCYDAQRLLRYSSRLV